MEDCMMDQSGHGLPSFTTRGARAWRQCSTRQKRHMRWTYEATFSKWIWIWGNLSSFDELSLSSSFGWIEWICALSLCRRWCYTGVELIRCNAPDSRVILTSFCRDRIKEVFVVPSAFKKIFWFWASHAWRRGRTLGRICIKVLLFFISWTEIIQFINYIIYRKPG